MDNYFNEYIAIKQKYINYKKDLKNKNILKYNSNILKGGMNVRMRSPEESGEMNIKRAKLHINKLLKEKLTSIESTMTLQDDKIARDIWMSIMPREEDVLAYKFWWKGFDNLQRMSAIEVWDRSTIEALSSLSKEHHSYFMYWSSYYETVQKKRHETAQHIEKIKIYNATILEEFNIWLVDEYDRVTRPEDECERWCRMKGLDIPSAAMEHQPRSFVPRAEQYALDAKQHRIQQIIEPNKVFCSTQHASHARPETLDGNVLDASINHEFLASLNEIYGVEI